MNLVAMMKKYDNFAKRIELSENSGGGIRYVKNIVIGLFDYIVFGSTVTDFFELTFYKKTFLEKKMFMTWRDHKKLFALFDDEATMKKLSNKSEMYKQMKNCVGRDMIESSSATKEELQAFVEKHETFLYKPNNNSCGRGIRLINSKDYDLEDLYHMIRQEDATLDELIVQHSKMQSICDKSVNTIRIFTLRIGEEIHFVGAALRMGAGNSVVDNYSAGGLVGAIDLESGKVIAPAENMYGKRFDEHPYSHVKMTGFQIPLWEELLKTVEVWAKRFELNYVAWDVAIRENDCVLVEANPQGMINTIQVAGATGRKQQYIELVKQWKKYEK